MLRVVPAIGVDDTPTAMPLWLTADQRLLSCTGGRQVAVTVVIRVEVVLFLGAVQRVVVRVEIEDDLLRCRAP